MFKKLIPIIGLLLVIAPVIADTVTVQTTVQKYISVTFNYSSVNFGTLTAGTSDQPAPDQTSGVYNVSIDTNYAYTVSASGTDFSDGGSHTFSISNLKLDTNDTASNLALGSAVTLSSSSQTIDSYADTVTSNFHGYWLTIPSGQYATTYSSTVTITYANQ